MDELGDGQRPEQHQDPGLAEPESVPGGAGEDPAGDERDGEDAGAQSRRFRIAPWPALGGRRLFPSLFLPGQAFHSLTPVVPAVVSEVLTANSAHVTRGLLELMPQPDVSSLIPKFDFLPARPASFPPITRQLEFPWTRRIAEILAPLRERMPPNWPDDIDFGQVQAIIQDDGLPIVWVPRADIVTELLAAPHRAARVEVLLDRQEDIAEDCRQVLGSISRGTLAGQLPLAVRALEAFGAGHHEAALALATVVTETAVTHAIGNYAEARRRAAFDPARVTLRQLRVQAALAPIGPFYAAWYPSSGTPAPEALSRHVTVHQADARHYTRGNAVVAVLLTTSVLRAIQDLADDTAAGPAS